MAIRSSAGSQFIRRSASLPSRNNVTMAGWFRTITNRAGNYRGFLALGGALTDPTPAQGELYVGWLSSNNFGIAWTNSGGSGWVELAFPSNPSLTDWVFCAVTCSGTASGNLIGYFANLGASTLTSVSSNAAGNNWTPASMYYNATCYIATEWHNGRCGPCWAWDGVLTAAELDRVRKSYTPERFLNLHGWWPIFSHTGDFLNDVSGNDRTLTVGSGVSTEDGPPIMWAHKSYSWLLASAPPAPPPAKANKIGLFDTTLRADSWFDAGFIPEGMFDYAGSQTHELIFEGAPPPPPTVSVAALVPASHVISPFGPQ